MKLNNRSSFSLQFILVSALLAGCGNTANLPASNNNSDNAAITESTTVGEEVLAEVPSPAPSPTYPFMEMKSDDSETPEAQSLGTVGEDWSFESAADRQVIFDGNPIERSIRFFGAEGINEYGYFLLVNGFIQPYQVIETNQRIDPPPLNQELTMARLNVPDGDEVEMTVSFTPSTGQIGDKLCLASFIVNYPDFIPESEVENSPPSLSRYVKLLGGYSRPLAIVMEENSDNSLSSLNVGPDVSQDERSQMEKDTDAPQFYLYSQDDPSKTKWPQLLNTDNGKLNLTFSVIGGQEQDYRVTVFVNAQPVEIEGYGSFLIHTQLDKMVSHSFTLDFSGYDQPSTVFAILVSVTDRCVLEGQNFYLIQSQPPITVMN